MEAAIKHRAVSWNDLRDDRIIKDWVLDDPETDEISTDKQAAIVRGAEHELRSLVRPNLIRSGKLVSLPTSPLPFLKVAPLLDGRWVDTAILELAELGVILTDSGFTPGKSRDPHPVAWEEFVQTDSRGAPTPVDDAAWHKARRAAAVRIRAYRGRRRVIEGRDYVEFALYQRSRKHSLDNRLDASTESGFVVADWNDWVKNQGPAAALAGIAVRPIDSRVDAEAWTVHHADRARRLQAARANLVGKLRPSELEERKGSCWSRKPAFVRVTTPSTYWSQSRGSSAPWTASAPATSKTTRSSTPTTSTTSTPAATVSTPFWWPSRSNGAATIPGSRA